MALNAGDLNHEFTLQSPSCDSGNPWTDVETGVWGSLRYATGYEALQAGAAQAATGQFVVLLRYRTDLEASWRLYEPETGRSFQITSFGDPDGSKEALRVLCAEAQ